MDSPLCAVTYLTLKDIQKVITGLGDFVDTALDTHSHILVVNSTGETTFTSSGWRLLSEAGFSYPLTKVISNAAMHYTEFCGEDCKYFLFILREMFNAMQNRENGNDELYVRTNLINEVCLMKRALPCLFKAIQNISRTQLTELSSNSFFQDLNSIVLTFMSSRFSPHVSKVLCNLICDFVEKISDDSSSLTLSLEYVISHFDIFCCKILSPVAESKVSKGSFFYRKGIAADFSIENCKFVVLWDLSMKLEVEDVSWRISDVSFTSQLNSLYVFKRVFEYFKSQNIMLILTSSVCEGNLKLLCEKCGINILDRLEKEEIECMLTCFNLCALENLNESLDSHHIGELSFAKSFSCNKSYFLHLNCNNPVRLFAAHHILLSAPYNNIWKEYYLQCLNCFKLIHQWLKSDSSNLCVHNDFEETLNVSTQKLSMQRDTSHCYLCFELKNNYENVSRKIASYSAMKSHLSGGVLLAPGLWELILKNILCEIPENLSLSCSVVLQAMHLAIVKCICKKIGISFTDVNNIDCVFEEFVKNSKIGDVSFLEPVVCKEIMIYSALDLILQLLRIESIVFTK